MGYNVALNFTECTCMSHGKPCDMFGTFDPQWLKPNGSFFRHPVGVNLCNAVNLMCAHCDLMSVI